VEYDGGRAGVEESQDDLAIRGVHAGVGVEFVRERARGTDALFLGRNADDHVARRDIDVRRIDRARQFADRRQIAIGGRQLDPEVAVVAKMAVGRLEVEHRCQIAANRAPPRREVALVDAETPFDELDDRGVVEHL